MALPRWRYRLHPEALRVRARALAQLRAYFADTGAMEVETPVMVGAAVTDPGIESLAVSGASRWLQTSPESAMKRLLAAGSGDIYQIARCFRAGDRSAVHSEEFTMVEWYRCIGDHAALVDEALGILQLLLGTQPVERVSYAQAMAPLDVDPHTSSETALRRVAAKVASGDWDNMDRGACLDLLFSHSVAPSLPSDRLTVISEYPICLSALAASAPGAGGVPVAQRFEIFCGQLELVNGCQELTEVPEHVQRAAADRAVRARRGLPDVADDERLLAALEHGLPACAGAAMGLDRVLMLRLSAAHIDEVRATDTL